MRRIQGGLHQAGRPTPSGRRRTRLAWITAVSTTYSVAPHCGIQGRARGLVPTTCESLTRCPHIQHEAANSQGGKQVFDLVGHNRLASVMMDSGAKLGED